MTFEIKCDRMALSILEVTLWKGHWLIIMSAERVAKAVKSIKEDLSERFPILSTKDVTTTCTKIIYCLFSRGLGNLERIPHRFSLIITKYCVE